MFKIAVDAGHYLGTAGKRLPKELDPAQTREWVINDRVARHFAAAAALYEDVEILRVDDPTGKTLVSLTERCRRANEWDADFYLSCHHNAGANLTNAGGIVAFSYRYSKDASPDYRDAIYDACIAAGGIKGNRADPKQGAGYDVLKYTKMPAVLMEYGFMDSRMDYKIILEDAYSRLVAYATMEGIVKIAGLKKKTAEPTSKTDACTVELRVLRNGASGADVKAMQLLLEANDCKGQMDESKYGSFGSKTEAAVKLYQKKSSLTANGICDSETWSALLGVTT